jgi:hypothetical protein
MKTLLVLVTSLALFFGSKRQALDTDVAHWVSYVFNNDEATVTVKVPPGFRVFRPPRPPMATYDRSSQRRVMSAQYDFGDPADFDLAEFEISGAFIHLAEPVSVPADPDTIDAALMKISHRSGIRKRSERKRTGWNPAGTSWEWWSIISSSDLRSQQPPALGDIFE